VAASAQPPRRGPGIVEPIGYAVTQFVASIAIVAGIGLAPDGLLLFAAALILSVIDLRRFRAANPGVIPETPEGFETPSGKVLMRLSMIATGAIVVLSALSLYLVHREHERVASIGPALVAGVITLFLNWRLKVRLETERTRELAAAARRLAQELGEDPPTPRDEDDAAHDGDVDDARADAGAEPPTGRDDDPPSADLRP
jgi:hypothetical protein